MLSVLAVTAQLAPPPPPGCEGTDCRRAKCGDICTATDCSHWGNVCAGGASAPVGPGWKYESAFEAPPYPPDFTPHNATIFYYFNLLSKGQFVPQLTLGNGLCNGTGPPTFACTSCDPSPADAVQWYMQAQYFWTGHDPDPGGAGGHRCFLHRRSRRFKQREASADGCHVIAGPLIPVNPGELVTTRFTIDEAAVWHASIGTPDGRTSAIEVPFEWMERNQTWPKTIGLGTCMEVDDLMHRGYYPPHCPELTVTVTAPAGTEDGWQQPWRITENPTCLFGPSASTAASVASARTSTTKINYQWPTPPPKEQLPEPPRLARAPPPLYYVRAGVDVSSPPLLESNSSNRLTLQRLCLQTDGCAGFTIGSGGGEPGDLPPHDCRGSRLYSAVAIESGAHSHAGVDLVVFGSESPANASTITPKPASQAFPQGASVQSVLVDGVRLRAAPGSATDDVLVAALERYARITFVGNDERTDRAASMAAGTVTQLLVNVTRGATDAPLALGVDESYELVVRAGASTLRASTTWGALRGLETWSQLVVRSALDGMHLADVQTIADAPQYAYRGFLVDTARHFLPLGLLFAVLDGMAYEKLNVLHWHAVDDQSFPLALPELPELAPAAAFAPELVYSVENVSSLVAYARLRGIRVLIEFDTPGHCAVLQRAYPDLGLVTECPGTTCWPPLDVSRPSTLQFVRTVWQSLARRFPDEAVFIGGDECHMACWAANPQVAAWARAHNLSISSGSESVGGEGTVFGWFVDRVVETVHGELGRTPVMWSPLSWDPSHAPRQLVSSGAMLNLWTGAIHELAYNITRSGSNDVVMSAGWYLDSVPSDDYYEHEPGEVCTSDASSRYRCSDAQRERIRGGEACMWGEGVDATNFASTVWPALTQVAERLWSTKEPPHGGLDLLSGRRHRLRVHRCRMLGRKLPVPPMSAVYMPDASHASFATWRKYSWCPGDANAFGSYELW